MSDMTYFIEYPHPAMDEPPDLDVKIWRYVGLPKFLDLLCRGSLHMARADRLGDAWEGSVGPVTKAAQRALAEHLKIRPELMFHPNQNKIMRENTAVSCWHMNECESAFMWDLYGNHGVAIQSTYRRLRDQFRVWPKGEGFEPFTGDRKEADIVHMGMVRYIDYSRDVIPLQAVFSPLLYKRKSFEHEREVRLMNCRLSAIFERVDELTEGKGSPTGHAFDVGPIETIPASGIYVPVDVGNLIEKVYIAPTEPPWFIEMVRTTVGRLGLDPDLVLHSEMGKDPIF